MLLPEGLPLPEGAVGGDFATATSGKSDAFDTAATRRNAGAAGRGALGLVGLSGALSSANRAVRLLVGLLASRGCGGVCGFVGTSATLISAPRGEGITASGHIRSMLTAGGARTSSAIDDEAGMS